MKIFVKAISHDGIPSYATEFSSGCDLRAFLPAPVELLPGQRYLVPTGLFMAIPKGYEGQVRPRSGLAVKHGVMVLNTPGTVDSDYRGEIKVILINLGDKPFVNNPGERIAQMVFTRYEKAGFVRVEDLDETERGEGGFGHSGTR